MATVAASAGRSADGFVGMVLSKADGSTWGYVPSSFGGFWSRRREVRSARRWAAQVNCGRLFFDTKRRDGTTYWKRIA